MSILTLRNQEREAVMNKSKAIKIAIAFKRGAAFIRGMRQLAQDADVPEGARWITIGAHTDLDRIAQDLDQNTTVKVRTIK